MKHSSIYTSLLLLSSCYLAFAQHSPELDKRNGFKDIKLTSAVDSVKGTVYKNEITNKDGQISKIYSVEHADYKKIGEVNIENIELTTYKNQIYIIRVITEKDLRLMKGMEMALGKAEWDIRNEQYVWRGEKLSLSFKSVDKEKIELTYTSFPILQKMKDDKKKVVEDIADDF